MCIPHIYSQNERCKRIIEEYSIEKKFEFRLYAFVYFPNFFNILDLCENESDMKTQFELYKPLKVNQTLRKNDDM